MSVIACEWRSEDNIQDNIRGQYPWGWNSGSQAQAARAFTAEPSHQARGFLFFGVCVYVCVYTFVRGCARSYTCLCRQVLMSTHVEAGGRSLVFSLMSPILLLEEGV